MRENPTFPDGPTNLKAVSNQKKLYLLVDQVLVDFFLFQQPVHKYRLLCFWSIPCWTFLCMCKYASGLSNYPPDAADTLDRSDLPSSSEYFFGGLMALFARCDSISAVHTTLRAVVNTFMQSTAPELEIEINFNRQTPPGVALCTELTCKPQRHVVTSE